MIRSITMNIKIEDPGGEDAGDLRNGTWLCICNVAFDP